MEATRRFLALTGRKLYVVGPLLPSSVDENATKNELSQSPKAQEIEAFMERILRTNGEKSLIYVWLCDVLEVIALMLFRYLLARCSGLRSLRRSGRSWTRY